MRKILPDQDISGIEDLPYNNALTRGQRRAPQPPKGFHADRLHDTIRFTIVERNRLLDRSAAVGYLIKWARECDTTNHDTTKEAFSRSVAVSPLIQTGGKEGRMATWTLTEKDYLLGYFFCVGVDITGEEGETFSGPIDMAGENDGTVPGDVELFDATEIGREYYGVPMSVIQFQFRAPKPLKSFHGIQLVADDYPLPGQQNRIHFERYTGAAGGYHQGEAVVPPLKRPLEGTVTVTNGSAAVSGSGTAFNKQCNVGDYLELNGDRLRILLVHSDTSLTLQVPWSGESWTGADNAIAIGTCRIYALAVADDGAHRIDIEKSPYVDLTLDAELSAPLAPSFTATARGNGVSIEITQLTAKKNEIAQYHIYRATGVHDGSTVKFTDSEEIGAVPHNPNRPTATLEFIDTDFTVYQKENAQVFSYYVRAENVRRQMTTVSDAETNVQTSTCRLDSNQDGDPTIPSRSGASNRLWNAFLGNTGGNVDVSDTDTGQDNHNATTSAAGSGDYAAWSRWGSTTSGAAGTEPEFINGNEVILYGPGSTKFAQIHQNIDAWDNTNLRNKKIPKDGIFNLSFYAKRGGTACTGTLECRIEIMDTVPTTVSYARRRYRDPADDSLKFYAASTASDYEVDAADLDTDWQRFHAVFWMQDSGVTADSIRVIIRVLDNASGEDVYITKPQLTEGEELHQWTGDMGNVQFYYPDQTGIPPLDIGDGPGKTGPHYQ